MAIKDPNQNDPYPDDVYDDGDDDHRQGPRQPAVTEEAPISDIDVPLRVDATGCGLSSADELNYSASCESPQSDGRKTGPKKLKPPRHRRLSQKYEMMSPSSTDEVEASYIWPMANDEAASTALVELSAIGKSVKHFMFTKSEEERESRVFNVRSIRPYKITYLILIHLFPKNRGGRRHFIFIFYSSGH